MLQKQKHFYEFGQFRLAIDRPSLWKDGEMVSIPQKALEVLILLVGRKGEIVSREELLETVWSDTFVEDGNINYTISLLRKTFHGNSYIATVPKHGYRFTAPVSLILGEYVQNALEVPDEPTPDVPAFLDTKRREEKLFEGEDLKNTSFRKRPSRSFYFVAAIFSLLIVGGVAFIYTSKTLSETPASNFNDIRFQRLTDTGDVAYLVISPEGDYVAFTREKDLYIKELQSASELKLNIENDTKLGCLQFSPDSNFIYFGSYLENSSGKISKVPRFGGIPKLVAENVWSGFSLSPDGKLMAFHRKFPNSNRSILVIRNLETGSERTLAQRNLPEQYYWNNYPAWSPDSNKIAVVIDNYTEHFIRLLVIDIDSESEEEIETPAFRNVEQAIWAADGRSIIASANIGESFQLWRIPYPDGETRRITNDLDSYLGISVTKDGSQIAARQRTYYSNIWVASQENLNDLHQLTVGMAHNDGLKGLSWLDDETIAYTSNAEKLRDWNLWTVNLNDRRRQELTSDKGQQNDNPVASAAGDVLYFSSNRDGQTHIYRVNAAGENLEQVTHSENESEIYPQISSDGSWLFYLKKGANKTAIYKLSLADGVEHELPKSSAYFPENFLSLSPDSKYLAFQILPDKGSIEEISGEIKIGIIETADPESIKTFKLPVASEFFKWKLGEHAIDYVVHGNDGAQIMRQSLDSGRKPALIIKLPKDDIFGFAWSRDGRKIALSRGQLLRNVVLLSGVN